MSFIALIPGLVILGLLLFGAVKSVMAIVRVMRPERAAGFPRCGACAYDVGGLPTWTCPECGRDLRRVGVTGTHQRRVPFSKSLSEGLAAVAVLCLLVGIVLLVFWLSVRPNDTSAWAWPLGSTVLLWILGSVAIWLFNRRAERRHREELLRPFGPPNAMAAGPKPINPDDPKT